MTKQESLPTLSCCKAVAESVESVNNVPPLYELMETQMADAQKYLNMFILTRTLCICW